MEFFRIGNPTYYFFRKVKTMFQQVTIIRTGITVKKIPYYLRASSCKWCIIENAKIF